MHPEQTATKTIERPCKTKKEKEKTECLKRVSTPSTQKEKQPSAGRTYTKKQKEKQKNLQLIEQEAYRQLRKKNFRKSAALFLKAGKPLLSKDAYISGAEKALKNTNPDYKYSMKNYQLAGLGKRGKKRAVEVMIKQKKYSRAFALAKKVGPAFYKEALIIAGDFNLKFNIKDSVSYYKQAGLKDYHCRIGDFFLKGKKPDFKNAENWFARSSDTSCRSNLLSKALQVNDTYHIKKYSNNPN